MAVDRQKKTPANRTYSDGRSETVHVVAPVTVVAEQQLVIVLRGAAQGAGLALNALPRIRLHHDLHVGRELQTR